MSTVASPLSLAVTSGRLLAAGHDSHEIARSVRTGARVRLRRGVVSTDPTSTDAMMRAAAAAAGALLVVPGSVVSHVAAAKVLGMAAVGDDDVVCVTRTVRVGSRRRPTAGRVHLHMARLDQDEVIEQRGVLLTSPARTAADLLRSLQPPESLALLDAMLRVGMASRGDVASVLARQHRWPGVHTAYRVLAAADGDAESPLESRVRAAFAFHPTAEQPAVQQVLKGASGRTYRVDLCWTDQWTIVEVDGRVKYDDPRSGSAAAVLWEEKKREDDLREAGWEVVRAIAADLRRPSDIRERVRRAVDRAARRHGSGRSGDDRHFGSAGATWLSW